MEILFHVPLLMTARGLCSSVLLSLPYRGVIVCCVQNDKPRACHSDRAQRRGISVSTHFSFLLSPFYSEFSPDVEMTMFQCATIGPIALNIVYNPFTKVHYTYAGGKSANSIRKFPVIL